MINGLYNSASGMNAELTRQEVVSNNLANVSTTGFKKDEAVFTSFPNSLIHRINDRLKGQRPDFFVQNQNPVLGMMGHGVQTHSVVTQFSDGNMTLTDNPLDLAISGQALFTVERSDGSHAYTRAGNFTENSSGYLTTQSGDLVMGNNGQPIDVSGNEVVVDSIGRIAVDGHEVSRLQLTAWDPDKMVKLGESLYTRIEADIEPVVEEPKVDAKIVQGFLEQSNTHVVEEMVNMITVMRAYEANQKSIQIQDESLGKVVNEVGKV